MKMTYKEELEETIFEIEEKIIEWAKLLATCKPNSTRFETRIQSIEYCIRARQGLIYLDTKS